MFFVFFLNLSEGMDREKSGKSQGILRWMISGNPGWIGVWLRMTDGIGFSSHHSKMEENCWLSSK